MDAKEVKQLMTKEVMEFLDKIQCVVYPGDETLIGILIDKVGSDLRSVTNLDEIPEDLHEDYVLAVAGELLLIKKGSGQLDLSALSFDGIKQISEGDTSVTFADDETAEGKFNSLIAYLLNWQEKAKRFRRMVW